MNVLFEKYPNVAAFPKIEEHKITSLLTSFSSVLYSNHCILCEINLNLLYKNNKMRFR